MSDSPRPRVSLTVIARDEEAHLPACLKSVAGLADEVVVVDTGSTDRTREVARALGANVYDVPWADSFAAARNAALDRATGDWAFWMDADDRLGEANRDRLRAVLAGLGPDPAAYLFACRCEGMPGEPPTVLDQVRLFPNRPAYRWAYRVHEQVLPALQAAGCPVRRAPVTVTHVGYADPAARRRKLKRNVRLAGLDRRDRPADPIPVLHLGAAALELGDRVQGVRLLEECLAQAGENPAPVRRAYALLAEAARRAGDAAGAVRWCRAGRAHWPADPELLFRQAAAAKDLGDWAGAEALLRELVTGPDDPAAFGMGPAGLRGALGRHALAGLLLEAGRPAEAAAEWEVAVALDPAHLPALAGLAEALLRLGRWADLEARCAVIAGLGRIGGEAAAQIRVRGLIARGDLAGADAAAEEAVRRFPRSVPLRVLRTHPPLLAGDHAKAEATLLDVLALDARQSEAVRNLAILQAKGLPPAGD